MLASRVPRIVNQGWKFRIFGVPLLAALTFATVSCDSRQELAQKNLAEVGVEANGLSLVRAVQAGDHKTTG